MRIWVTLGFLAVLAGSASAEPAVSIVGKWRGHPVPKLRTNAAEMKKAEAIAEQFVVDLEIKKNGRFEYMTMGIATEGIVIRRGSALTLTPDHIMGMTVAEAQREKKAFGADVGKPTRGEISADGKSITIFDPTGGDKKVRLVRITESPKVVGRSTVSAAESKLVGTYKVVFDPKAVQPGKEAALKSFVDHSGLKLGRDNRFSLTLAGETVEGGWAVKDGKVRLMPTNEVGSGKKLDKADPMNLVIQGARLIPVSGEGAPPITFVRG